MNPKRKKSGELTQSSKKQKISQSEADEALGMQSAMEEFSVGVIESVKLLNFMCHEKLEIKLGSNINFITGRNGSGKSAILTAVMVGLGGRAQITSRGNSLKCFIKNGKNWAEIKIVLKNSGSDAYKPEVYGHQIVIVRRIKIDGSASYRLQSAEGRRISEKKEELDNILDNFNICVDNPVTILTQETSKNFLFSKNPHDKYNFFLKATQLDLTNRNIQATEEQRRIADTIVLGKEQLLPELEQEVDVWRQKFRYHQSMDGLREKIENLKNEAAWAEIVELEKILAKKLKEVNQSENQAPSILQEVRLAETKVKGAEEKLRETSAKIKKLTDILSQLKEDRKATITQVTKKKEEWLQLDRLRNRQRSELLAKESDRKELEERIKYLESFQKDKSQIVVKMGELQRQREEKNARKVTMQQDYDQQANALSTHGHTLRKLQDDEKFIMQKVTELSARLESHLQNRNSCDKYGHEMRELLNRISSAYDRREFKEKPIGPIGLHITLKDNKWALAVERCLGGLLQSFVVDNYNDEGILEQLMKECLRNQRRPAIICTRFEKRLYSVSSNKVNHESHQALMDAINVDVPALMNVLIDQVTIVPICNVYCI